MKKISALIFSVLLAFAAPTQHVLADKDNSDVYVRYAYNSSTVIAGIETIPEDATVIITGLDFSSDTGFKKSDLLTELKKTGQNVVLQIDESDEDDVDNYKAAVGYYSDVDGNVNKSFVKGFEFQIESDEDKSNYEDVLKDLKNKKWKNYARVTLDKLNLDTTKTIPLLQLFDFVTLAPEFSDSVTGLTTLEFNQAYKTVITNAKALLGTSVKLGAEFDYDYTHDAFADEDDEDKQDTVDEDTITELKDILDFMVVSGDTDYDAAANAFTGDDGNDGDGDGDD